MPEKSKLKDQLCREGGDSQTLSCGFFTFSILNWTILDCMQVGMPVDIAVFLHSEKSKLPNVKIKITFDRCVGDSFLC